MVWAWAPKASSNQASADEGDATRGAGGAKALPPFALGLALCSSGLCALSVSAFASPLWTLIALSPLFVATRGQRAVHALGLGWLTGALATFVGYAFVPPALIASEALSPVGAWAALGGFALFRGAWLGLAVAMGSLAGRRRSPLLVSAVMVAALELSLPNPLPFAFGSPLVIWPALAQVASVLGEGGLTLVAALSAALIAALLAPARADASGEKDRTTRRPDRRIFVGRDWTVLVVGSALLIVAISFGALRLLASGARTSTGQLEATLLHTDRDPRAPGPLPELPAGARDVLVLPESAIAETLPARDSRALVDALYADRASPTLLGFSERTISGELYNVARLTGATAGRYEKRTLLPFAEASYASGRETDPITIAGHPLTIAICSEETEAHAMRDAVRSTRGEAIVTLSNDAWFDGSVAGELHLLAARVRAIETGRSVLRASNGGVSAAIDPNGRVIARSTEAGPLDVSAPFSQERTPYLRFGNAPLWLLLATLAAIALSPLPGAKISARASSRRGADCDA